MELVKDKWTKEDYNEFIKYLDSIKDIKRADFNRKIINDEDANLIYYGLLSPTVKNISKSIMKGDYKSFIKLNTFKSYEEKAIYGNIIINLKTDYDETVENIYEFLKIITNWALVDMTAGSFKALKNNPVKTLELAKTMLKSKNHWEVRYGILILMGYFINDEYIDEVLKLSLSVTHDHYYVKMGNAWLISVAYIKFPKETLKVIKSNKLDVWTHNKAIQKIRESFRVTKEDKDYLNTLKRK